jgi:DNA-binding transcriptional MocR family regulator
MEIYIFQVLVVNGGVAAMEVLACCLLDPGDVVLTPSPCYTRIFVNFSERFEVVVVDVLLRDKNEVSSGLQKHVQYSGAWIGQNNVHVACI